VVATNETANQYIKASDSREALPDELRKSEQFCFWGVDTDRIKRPATWDGSNWDFLDWKNPGKLVSCLKARHLGHRLGVGVGLVVPDLWVIIDFDKCRNLVTGEIVPAVKKLIERLDTVVCISSSGTGLHVFVRLRSNSDLPKGSKLTNPAYSPGKKVSELKKPGTFVALSWNPLPGYSALDKPARHLPDWLMPLLFRTKSPALEPPRECTGDTAIAMPSGTLSEDAARLRETFFKGYTSGGYIWRLLQFRAENTHPFVKQPELVSDRSQWIILVVRDYFQHVPDANNEDAIKLSEAYDIHWLKHSPHEFANKPPHNDLWHKNQVLKQRDVADAKMRSERTDINHPVSVTNAIWKIVQESANPLLTSNEKLILGAITQQIQQQRDLSVKISNEDMASLTGRAETTLKEPKKRLVGRNLPWLEITTASRTTTYRIVLSR